MDPTAAAIPVRGCIRNEAVDAGSCASVEELVEWDTPVAADAPGVARIGVVLM